MRINIRRNAALAATCLSCLGVIATAVLAVKKVPEATQKVEERKAELEVDELPILETIKVAAPICWPIGVAAVSTMACIIGINAIDRKNQASLLAAYGVAAKTLKKYDGKVKELFGADAPFKVKTAIAQDTADEVRPSKTAGDAVLFYDMISERYFTSTMLEVRNAEYHFNRNFILRGGQATLNEFYEFLGLDPVEEGDTVGWDISSIGDFYGYEWIDFDHDLTKITGDEGDELECYILSCPFPPCYLDMGDGEDPIEFDCAKTTPAIMKEA